MRDRLTALHVRDDGYVTGDSQSAYALALDAAIVPAPQVSAAMQRLEEVLVNGRHRITVGEIGLPALLRVLARAGRHDLLHRVITEPEGPGYVNMLNSGCTALAETWEVVQGEASANHFMLGSVVTWFVEDLAGLRQAPDSIGWTTALIHPQGVNLLDHASVTYASPVGRYELAWQRHRPRATVSMIITVPQGGRALIRSPCGWTSEHEGKTLGAGRSLIILKAEGPES